ncbi:MAG: DUF1445 domain-containing protein, partial [Ornithinimicrobium sp.]
MSIPTHPDGDVGGLLPVEARSRFAEGLKVPTAGWSRGFAQANVIALPQSLAFDMMVFAQRNPKPCPLLEVIGAGSVRADPRGTVLSGAEADIRRDLPLYRVFEHGELVDEVADASSRWRDDLVTFVIGCSFTFEHPLLAAGVPVRHIGAG